MPHQPRRSLADWTPDDIDVDAWLQQWAAAGWVPEHEWGASSATCVGRRSSGGR